MKGGTVEHRTKPQDILVALKLLSRERQGFTYPGLAEELVLSASEAHAAVRRLAAAQLYDPSRRVVNRTNLREFLLHGIRYAFPGRLGGPAVGLPTAVVAGPLAAGLVLGEEDAVVWPVRGGRSRGRALTPLYRSAPAAAARDPALHELLSLVDVLRVGRARERTLAGDLLTARLAA